jgi:phage terminase large subunit
VLHGGRSSSKSWDAAGIAVQFARMATIRVLCTRQFQNKITESVYTLLKIQIDRFGLAHEFDISNTSIKHKVTGSEFLFYGLWRHIDEIKSLESIDICWIEEAHNLTSEQWEVLEPTLRSDESQFWVIFNPKFATDFVYQRFVVNPPPNTIVRQINYLENPFLSETILKVIAAKKAEDLDDYEHVYLGVPRDSDDRVVIKRGWVMAAIDAHKTVIPSHGDWLGQTTVGYDVADDGNDANATTAVSGSVCVDLDEWDAETDELMKSARRVYNTAKRVDASSIGYDSIGVGAGTGSNLVTIDPSFKHWKFNAGAGVVLPKQMYSDTGQKNGDYFSNLKAQAWWSIADRFRNTYLAVTKGYTFAADEMISISSECDSKMLNQLIDELATPLRDFDNASRVKVESKKDLAKRKVKSPNIADSFIIAYIKVLIMKQNSIIFEAL